MELLPYISQVSLYCILLYSCYWLVLRSHTFFAWNRAYLLGALLFSFGLPLLKYPESAPPVPATLYRVAAVPLEKAKMTVTEAPAFMVVAPTDSDHADSFLWLDVLWIVYAAGGMFMLVRLVFKGRVLFSFLQSGELIPMQDYTLILLDNDRTGSFSFLHYIVINRTDYAENLETILNHELVHVRQRHSWDVLLVEVLRVLFWFNPVLILYKNSLQQVHEYLADAAAPQRDRYAGFLLTYAMNNPANTLTNTFLNQSHLKNRIKMLYKTRNSKWALGKYLTILPLIGLVLMLTSARERVAEVLEKSVQVPASVRASTSATELPQVPVAETTTVKGTVRSSKTKDLMPGANVVLAGTSRGTTTDANGAFELKEVPLESTLAISYVGYETRTVEITKKNQVLNVVLEWKQNSLQDVVIVAYLPIAGSRPQPGVDSTEKGKQFTVVEQVPEFPGGITEMYKFLARNIRYPTEAIRADMEGKVVLTFTVSDKGRIRNPQVIQSLGGGTDEEALRVVLTMPSWTPAQQNGSPVAMEYILPIEFRLEKPQPKEDKEKRQGNTTRSATFFNYNKSELGDFGSSGSIQTFGAPEVNPPASSTSKMRFSTYSSRRILPDVAPPLMIIIPAYKFKKED